MLRELIGLGEEDAIRAVDWSWRAPLPTALLVLLLLTVLLFVWWLYRRERALSRGRRLLLGSLRAAGLMLLILLLAEPVLRLDLDRRQEGQVLVLVDTSRSMALHDQRLREADRHAAELALGRRSFAAAAAVVGPDALGTASSAAGPSRLQLVEAVLGNPELALLERLAERNRVQVIGFDGDLEGLEDPPWSSAGAGSERTALGSALRRATERFAGHALAGVVLFSDGGSNAGEDAVAVASGLGDRGIPVHTVGIGVAEPDDIRVRELLLPEAGFVGDRIAVRVGVQVRGFAGQPAELRLSLDGEEVVSQQLDLQEGVQFADLELAVEGSARSALLRAELTPLAGEASGGNNVLERPLRVIDEKIRVLYIERVPRWEYRYLRTVLLRDPRLEVHFHLTEGDPRMAAASPQHLPGVPQRREELLAYDLLVIGDVARRSFDTRQLAWIEELVAEQGASLLMIAGREHAPAAFADGPIAELLPVRVLDAGDERIPDDHHPRPVIGVAGGSLVDLAGDGGDPWRWVCPLHRLPRLQGVKPAAHVLLELPRADPQAPAYPLIAWQRFGAGTTMYVGCDQLWRLRFKRGDTHHARFWSQTIRFLTMERLLGGDRRLRLQADRDRYAVGDVVRVYLHARDESYQPLQQDAMLVGFEQEGRRQELELRPHPQRPGLYEGAFLAERAGEVVLSARHGEAASRLELPVLAIDRELREPAMDRALLEAIARRSGGRNHAIAELPALVAAIPAAERQVPVELERELWDLPVVFLLLLALFACEWTLRRRNDLA